MREPLTSGLLAEQLKRLLAVFPTRLASQNPAFMAETYKEGLRGIDGEALREAVTICIQTDQYFPKVARLRELANEWMRRNRAEAVAVNKGAWNICGVCGAEAKPKMITRPKLFDAGDPAKAHYLVIKATLFRGATQPVGAKVPRRDLLEALQAGVLFEMETVEGRQLVMDHKPGPHHVNRQRDEDVA